MGAEKPASSGVSKTASLPRSSRIVIEHPNFLAPSGQVLEDFTVNWVCA
jgi:hypothetical protein